MELGEPSVSAAGSWSVQSVVPKGLFGMAALPEAVEWSRMSSEGSGKVPVCGRMSEEGDGVRDGCEGSELDPG